MHAKDAPPWCTRRAPRNANRAIQRRQTPAYFGGHSGDVPRSLPMRLRGATELNCETSNRIVGSKTSMTGLYKISWRSFEKENDRIAMAVALRQPKLICTARSVVGGRVRKSPENGMLSLNRKLASHHERHASYHHRWKVEAKTVSSPKNDTFLLCSSSGQFNVLRYSIHLDNLESICPHGRVRKLRPSTPKAICFYWSKNNMCERPMKQVKTHKDTDKLSLVT
jgi:hypothetical protein